MDRQGGSLPGTPLPVLEFSPIFCSTMPAHRNLGSNTKRAIIRRYLQGESIGKIARSLGLGRTTVGHHLHAAGVQMRKPPAPLHAGRLRALNARGRYTDRAG
jgi:DNA-binding transcriptional ArsR family regulator